MKFIELTFDDPAANLACDEALLEASEAGSESTECLRIWQAKKHFVVLGHSNPLQSHVNLTACRDRGIPVFRRVSGGGTVVQGPGCLNYSLILRNDRRGLRNIVTAFEYILERHRLLVEKSCGVPASFEGTSDLAAAGRKFSGNAQYRKARCTLVHGTFLLNFDLSIIETLLPMPPEQPAYRGGRPHLQFITNLGIDPGQFSEHLKDAWECTDGFAEAPSDRTEQLVRDRYGKLEWTEKF